MDALSRRGEPVAREYPADRKRGDDLFGAIVTLAESFKQRGSSEPSGTPPKKKLDIPRLEKLIARYRQAIALQSSLLDRLEAQVVAMKQETRKKKPAKPKRRQ